MHATTARWGWSVRAGAAAARRATKASGRLPRRLPGSPRPRTVPFRRVGGPAANRPPQRVPVAMTHSEAVAVVRLSCILLSDERPEVIAVIHWSQFVKLKAWPMRWALELGCAVCQTFRICHSLSTIASRDCWAKGQFVRCGRTIDEVSVGSIQATPR